MSGQSLRVIGIRSDLGLLRLLARNAEFAMISTSLERAVASIKPGSPNLPYQDLMAFSVSRVWVAFAANPQNPVRSVSMEALRGVLAGKVTNWKELGGEDQPIRVVFVDGGDGVTLCVAGDLFGTTSLSPANPIRVSFAPQVVKVVEQEPRALGVAQLGLVKASGLPELATDGAIKQELNLVTMGKPTAAEPP
jgi:phosphate transport system substrate-binding protein